ncbi:hypothetical protein [Luteococcus sp.]|uniref:hypothetical protein n=1 Tax=Luteococcus sp. TaxID=1969402 RepID=UPI0037367647
MTAIVFLAVGISSLLVDNGIFSVGIAAMLIVYAASLAGIAWLNHRALGLASGAVVASSLLHVLVGVSTARGSHRWWIWIFVALAVVTMVAGTRQHLAQLRESMAD